MVPPELVIHRSIVRVGVSPGLRSRLGQLAAGRPLVVGYFVSRRCGVSVGDMTARFDRRGPGRGYVQLATIEGVPMWVDERLLPVLRDAELTLRWGGPLFARHLAISLEPASRWIDFLEQPGVLVGKRRYGRST